VCHSALFTVVNFSPPPVIVAKTGQAASRLFNYGFIFAERISLSYLRTS
jgi:hypothetical protein